MWIPILLWWYQHGQLLVWLRISHHHSHLFNVSFHLFSWEVFFKVPPLINIPVFSMNMLITKTSVKTFSFYTAAIFPLPPSPSSQPSSRPLRNTAPHAQTSSSQFIAALLNQTSGFIEVFQQQTSIGKVWRRTTSSPPFPLEKLLQRDRPVNHIHNVPASHFCSLYCWKTQMWLCWHDYA